MSEEEIYLAVVRMRIRQFRRERNLTQEDMAEMTQLTLRGYQRFEATKNNRFNPTLLNLIRIAEALDVNITQLVSDPKCAERLLLKK